MIAQDIQPDDAAPGEEASDDSAAPAPEEAPLTEEERVERARTLFTEGVQHSQAEAWSDAAASFEAALELRAAPAIRYNLATAYLELERYRDAREQLDAVEQDEETPENIAALSAELAERMRREAARLSVERPAELGDATVSLDAEALDDRWLDREIPVRPGRHVVTAARDGREIARAEMSVAAGERTHVVLGLGAVRLEPEEPETPVIATTSAPFYEDWVFWTAIGGGALVLTAVIVGVALATAGDATPVEGNFMPGVITW